MVSTPLALSAVASHCIADDCLLLATNGYYGSHSEINFLVFSSIWTILALIYLSLTSWKLERFAHPWIICGVESLTMLFWFAGFIAAAVFVGHLNACGGKACSSAKAATVFAAFDCKIWFPLTIPVRIVDNVMQGSCLPLQQPWPSWVYLEEVVPPRDPTPWAPKSFTFYDLVR